MTEPTLQESKDRLLAPLSGAKDITLLKLPGNLGDSLIEAGTEALLGPVPHLSIRWEHLWRVRGDLLIICGGGGWNAYYGLSPHALALGERNFRSVVVYPSTFDTSDRLVYSAISMTQAKLFARDWTSYDTVKSLQPQTELAHDGAFFFDLEHYRREGTGMLLAYRTDRESTHKPPEGNVDISLACASLGEWLDAIAGAEEVHTDRAHVLMVAALLGKKVFWSPNRYFKVQALVDTWFAEAENVVREEA